MYKQAETPLELSMVNHGFVFGVFFGFVYFFL